MSAAPDPAQLIFTGDNKAYTTHGKELTTITTSVTEYDIPDSMPAILPPYTIYTYCAEFSAEEAEDVSFQKPVTVYIEDFLNIGTGGIIPVGYYDRNHALWTASKNGIVVTLLDTDSDGIVDSLDADGDAIPDDIDNSGSFKDDVLGLDNPGYQPGLFDTNYKYNTQGRLTSIGINTRNTTLSYNSQGVPESITDPENHITTYTCDILGRITEINQPDGSSIGFTYDQNGNMILLTTPSIIDHGFGYNDVNLNTSYQTPISGSYSYIYDKDRRLVETCFPSGKKINHIYEMTRLVQIQTPEGAIDFTYLCGNKVESITRGIESIAFGYDGRFVTKEILDGTLTETLSYTYNNDFNLTSFTYAGGTTDYSYDKDQLLTGTGRFIVTRNAQNGLPEVVTDYILNLTLSFNGYGEVESQDMSINGKTITSLNLSRDNAGRITTKLETIAGANSDYQYTYDPMGRLLRVTKDDTLVEEYQYGPNGTRTFEMNAMRSISGRNYTYSEQDHLLTAGITTYQYDSDGFLTEKREGEDITLNDYSSRGELLRVDLPDGRVIEYIHDPLGRRIAKRVNGVITEKYLWQGLTRLLAVYDGIDNLLMRFEYADARMPVSMTRGNTTYYLSYDQVGSLRIVIDETGNVVKRINYDSFGNIISDSNPTFDVPFGFAGGMYDRDTGLVRFGFRDFDPDTGRWTAKDLIRFAG